MKNQVIVTTKVRVEEPGLSVDISLYDDNIVTLSFKETDSEKPVVVHLSTDLIDAIRDAAQNITGY